ncbi:hypothetical protein V5O48_017527 [Marasmius crinis-equi]|uniref:Uncharacterized protein n=1 Tax=Marasmius crinis-equi TaxID=585013 RepID=A0ABR3ENR7_9AGAR
MTQLYTTIKPDRERSLWYYEEMQRHDTYVLGPIDVPALQATFTALVENPKLRAQSMHYVALINAYGYVLEELPLAQNIFSSVSPPILDASVFEALVNVLVAHRRIDLALEYVELMDESGIYMTAFTADSLIRGSGH